MNNPKYLFLKLLLFLPIVLFVVAINLCIDTAMIDRKIKNKYDSDEFHVAKALIAGKNVELFRDINGRLLEKYWIESYTAAPDIVLLGSSRSMLIGSNIFKDKRIVNNSVSRATLADYLGVFWGYVKKGLYPEHVIILCDPQLITFVSAEPESWLAIKEDTYAMLDQLGVRSKRIKPALISPSWFNLFSFVYFQNAMEKLLQIPEKQGYVIVEGEVAERNLLLSDGRVLRNKVYHSISVEEAKRKAIREFNSREFRILFQSGQDQELKNILEKFITYLNAHHIQVALYLMPMHPVVYEKILESHKKAGDADIVGIENYYRELAKRFNLEIFGSYDPAIFGLGEGDFFDSDHVRDTSLEKIFTGIAK